MTASPTDGGTWKDKEKDGNTRPFLYVFIRMRSSAGTPQASGIRRDLCMSGSRRENSSPMRSRTRDRDFLLRRNRPPRRERAAAPNSCRKTLRGGSESGIPPFCGIRRDLCTTCFPKGSSYPMRSCIPNKGLSRRLNLNRIRIRNFRRRKSRR